MSWCESWAGRGAAGGGGWQGLGASGCVWEHQGGFNPPPGCLVPFS